MEHWDDIRRTYLDHPLDNGDALVVTNLPVVQQHDGMADVWDPAIRRTLKHVFLTFDVTEVLLAVARPHGELLAQDHAMWADLREDLLGTGIRMHPLEALPSAA